MTPLRCIYFLCSLSFLLQCQSREHTQEAQSTQSPAAAAFPEWSLGPFAKIDSVNPVLTPGTGTFRCPVRDQVLPWEDKDVFNPAVVVREGKLYLLYRAEDKIGRFAGTSRIGLAESDDGKHFRRRPEPVLYPDKDAWNKLEWEGGCEDPRVVEDENGVYYLTYTAYDGDKARLLVATSPDLVRWTKHGPAFAGAYNGKYLNQWSKSGSIVARYAGDGRIVAARINGKYWMYWGDLHIWAATSDDLIHWTPVERPSGEAPPTGLRGVAAAMPDLKTALEPRPGKFDSDLVEPGPPAMLTDAGILLIYNSRNAPQGGDTTLPEGAYTAGQALLDPNDPTRLLQRSDTWFIRPEKDYEVQGQINQVCFVEGLAWYKDRWWLYYGTADSKIAVAVK